METKTIKELEQEENLLIEFNKLDSRTKDEILIKWFGRIPLFKEMIKDKEGLKHYEQIKSWRIEE